MDNSTITFRKDLLILQILLIIGIVTSVYLLYLHLSQEESAFCTIGESFSCSEVNKGPYSNLDGISYLLSVHYNLPLPLIEIDEKHIILDFVTANAFLGFFTLSFVFVLTIFMNKKKKYLWIKPEKQKAWLLGIMIFSVSYGLYLIFIQHFILKTYCTFCLLLDAVLITSLIFALRVKK